ncbi:hypothetical protein GCM10027160_54990 [Streptomyces calidiresistens]|uniref:Uncharacterized protein n=1 Tax=Streptomyces calidiresistens TaxID=1485586 RepID=A0A7W3SZR6_9ACTN|nr:hypothetical protein [Streptomyces calidiresistens]MBB0228242.1 hypothetical protein [Streptomyces calidiresistens]
MPGTLTVSPLAPAESPATGSLLAVERLHPWERVLALYVSDLPTDFAGGVGESADVLIGWVRHGAARLGYRHLREGGRRAAHLAALRRAGSASGSQRAAYHRMFPDSARLRLVEDLSSSLVAVLPEPSSGWVGDADHSVYVAFGDDMDEVAV